MSDSCFLTKGLKELIFKLTALVVVQTTGISEPLNEIIEDALSCCPSGLVLCRISLGESCEVIHNDQDVLVPASAGLQVQIVNTYKIQGCVGCDGAHWSSYMIDRLFLLNARTSSRDVLHYVLLHKRPVKAL